MEIKVKELGVKEQKSVQELENELIQKHEESVNKEEIADQDKKEEDDDIDDQKVLSFIGKKFGKQLSSLDDLFVENKQEDREELPEDVSAFLKFKKETNRGLDDFIKINRSVDSLGEDDIIKEYLMSTQEGLDEEDISIMMEEYSYDEDLDDESSVKKAKLAKKKMVAQAKKYLNDQKEKYKIPIESKGSNLEDDEDYKAYKQYKSKVGDDQKSVEEKRRKFSEATDAVFSNEFKGFEFDIEGNKFLFSPANASELKKSQSDISNFVSKFLDENGYIKNAADYHKSLSIAMNPEKFAKFFYEQGASTATDSTLKKMKNVNMEERKAPQATIKGGLQVKPVGKQSDGGLRIKSKK